MSCDRPVPTRSRPASIVGPSLSFTPEAIGALRMSLVRGSVGVDQGRAHCGGYSLASGRRDVDPELPGAFREGVVERKGCPRRSHTLMLVEDEGGLC